MKLELFTVLSLALGVIGCTHNGESVAASDEEIANLTQRTAEANSALVRGDIDRYIALTRHSEDYTLMAPFGGAPAYGFDASSESRARMARFFKSGTLNQELVATYNSGDLAVLVTVERARAAIAELPEQNWSLRVTQVFRRDEAGWHLVHRHADPLVSSVSLEQAAALARGEQTMIEKSIRGLFDLSQ
jgi:ketosteroid isomerase-like protein